MIGIMLQDLSCTCLVDVVVALTLAESLPQLKIVPSRYAIANKFC